MTPRQQELMKLLVSKGLHIHGAAAVVGNCSQEVGINLPTKFTLVTDHGSQGLAQWRLERLTALEAFADSHKLPVTDLATQGLFLLDELGKNYPSLNAMLKNPGDRSIANLTANFMSIFERPSFDPAINKLDFRIKQAERCVMDYAIPSQPPAGGSIIPAIVVGGTTIALAGGISGTSMALGMTAIVAVALIVALWYSEHRKMASEVPVAPAKAIPSASSALELKSALEELKIAYTRVEAAKAVLILNRQEEDELLGTLKKIGGEDAK